MMKKNDNLGTLASTGNTKVGGTDDLEVKRFLQEEKNRSKEEKKR